ncbi:MAG: protoporphyrinogen oxidase HemJ [Alphaproteobacteria bacterium]
MDFLAEYHLWTKALHVIAVIAWMAGLLYLPRLFVYHTETTPGSPESERFKIMERRLLRAIMNPAMIATFVFGGMLLATPGIVDWGAGWIWTKLAAVALMTHFHHLMGRWRKDFAADRNGRSQRFFRIANEAPTLAMIVIVVMVVVKPF